MLSMTILTAITAVALPQLRITTLGMIRSMTLAYALAAFTIMQASTPIVITLFSDAVVIDLISTYAIITLLVVLVIVLAYYSAPLTFNMGTPYTITILTGILLVGAYYLITCGDIVTMVISLEIQSFSLYALTTVYRWREGATSAGLIYFMLGAFSSGLVLLGVSITYLYTGITDWAGLYVITGIVNDRIMTTSLIITITGLLFKVTAAPYHYWGPEVYDRVPTVITVVIAVLPKVALLTFIIRYSGLLNIVGAQGYLYISVVLSWAFGSILGLVQTRIKRLLAYSTISHVGWMLAGIVSGTSIGLGSVIYYLLQYSLTSTLTFITLIAIGSTLGLGSERIGPTKIEGNITISDVTTITSINGLYSRSIIFTLVVAVTLFSAAGIPPLAGFYAKLAIMQAILYSTSPLYIIIGVLSSVISAGFYLSVISGILFNTPRKG